MRTSSILTRLTRRIAVAALAVVAGAAVSLAASSPASAETYNGKCESGEVCLFYGTGYAGYIADMYDNVASYSGWKFYAATPGLNDNTQSGYGKSLWSFGCVSENANYGGKMFARFEEGYGGQTDFGVWRDKASSHRFLTSCSFN